MIPATLIIMLAGAPMAEIDGYAQPAECGHTLHLPHLEDHHHRVVSARVECSTEQPK